MQLAETQSKAYLSLSPSGTQRQETKKELETILAVDYLVISDQQFSEIK